MSISAIYFEIINCFNLIYLLISIPPSTKAVMKRQLGSLHGKRVIRFV